MKKLVGILVLLSLAASGLAAQDNRIDTIRADAPALADYGAYAVGVTTRDIVDPGRVDILSMKAGQPIPLYDRKLTCEVWYPAVPGTGDPTGEYRDVVIRDPTMKVSLYGKAAREANPERKNGPYPLVLISHGYPGNRFLMSPLAENLASKGYVVVSIDHKDSTYSDQGNFTSTLYNRSPDQLAVLNAMAALGKADPILAGMVDADTTALIGYSMGGYGVVNTLGGGLSQLAVNSPYSPGKILAARSAGDPGYEAQRDPRIKAGIAIAPWGMNVGFWDAAGLAGIRTPMFFIAGSKDTVAGYEPGSHTIFNQAVNSDRYFLTFENAAHNAAAPMPMPKEVRIKGSPGAKVAAHYFDPVWDTVRMNNIAQHFVTAYLAKYLRADPSADAWFDLVENGAAGVWSMDAKGQPKADHTYWKGFNNGHAVGLRMEHRKP